MPTRELVVLVDDLIPTSNELNILNAVIYTGFL